jgi:hypothetical protein
MEDLNKLADQGPEVDKEGKAVSAKDKERESRNAQYVVVFLI